MMRAIGILISAAILAAACERCALADERRLEREDLTVTEGALDRLGDGRLAVNVPKMRAVARRAGQRIAELRFKDLGPTKETARLASGTERRQIGLKLRALDGCNVLYVMWRLEPQSKLVVSLKRNPSKHTHAECGASGYDNIAPASSEPAPPVRTGESHVLRAELDGQMLKVLIDRVTVWRGPVGAEVLAIDGPAGIRTDNGRFELELYASEEKK